MQFLKKLKEELTGCVLIDAVSILEFLNNQDKTKTNEKNN